MNVATRSDAILERLLSLHPKRIDLVLDRIERLLAALGHPESRLPPVIHVAGTNGKGSTIAFMRAVLDAAERQVDFARMQREETLHNRVGGLHRVHIYAADARGTCIINAQSRASVARMSRRCTTISTMPCDCRYSAR
jgi:hypothetical protein